MVIPATSANIGAGFDSAGLALNRYLMLRVESSDQWVFRHDSPFLPAAGHFADHFIYRAAKHIADRYGKTLPCCSVCVESDVPLARGLGSSATANLAGIELANQLCCLALSDEEKLKYGVEWEGHPDNIAPALLGGMVFSAVMDGTIVEYVRTEPSELDFVGFIPDIGMDTELARGLIPNTFAKKDAARGSATGNVMVGALLAGDYGLAGRMMERDVLHEPYRKASIPNYDFIKREAAMRGAYGTVISGAGPAMIAFVPEGSGERVRDSMQPGLPDYDVVCLKMDRKGLRVI